MSFVRISKLFGVVIKSIPNLIYYYGHDNQRFFTFFFTEIFTFLA